MPSPLKRPIPGRLLASLRPPACTGPLPVQTGFPTSLADIVVKNHDRLKKPKRRHRPTAAATAPSSPTPAPVAALEPPPLQPQQTRHEGEVSPVRDRIGVAVRLRPELLGVGAAAALALLVIWSRCLVAAVTVASLSLFWIDSVRSSSSYRRRPRPPSAESAAAELPDSCGCGVVSPIREVESESAAATPRLSCADSDRGSVVSVSVSVSSLWTDERSQLDDGGDSTSHPTKRKEKRWWLRKLIAKMKPSKEKDSSVVSSDGEAKQPDTGSEVIVNAVAEQPKAEEAEQQSPSEPTKEEEAAAADGPRGGALPFAAFVPVVLVGLVAGKLPAVALTVLVAVFSLQWREEITS